MAKTSDREPTEAEALNTNEPLNPAGKPIQDGTELHEHDDDAREPVDEADHDAVWAGAIVSPHDPKLS